MNQPRIQRIERTSLLLVGLAVLVSLVLAPQRDVVLGVTVGGLLASLNFFALRRLIQGILREDGRLPGRALLFVLLVIKFGVLAASLYLVVRYLPVRPWALLVGISVVVISIFIEGFLVFLRGATAQSE